MKHDHDLAGDMSQMLEHPSWKAKIMCPDGRSDGAAMRLSNAGVSRISRRT